MNIKQIPNFILVSVIAHALLLWASFNLILKPVQFSQPGIEPQTKVLSIQIKQEEIELKTSRPIIKKKSLVKKEKKLEKSKTIKKIASNKISPVGIKTKNKFKIKAYTKQLKTFVEKHKIYPRMAAKLRQSGKLQIKLKITADGKFGNIRVISPAAFETLNKGAVKLFKKLGKFKPLPKELFPAEEFVIPIEYKLARRY